MVQPSHTDVACFWDHLCVTLGSHLGSSLIFHLYFEQHFIICKIHSHLCFPLSPAILGIL